MLLSLRDGCAPASVLVSRLPGGRYRQLDQTRVPRRDDPRDGRRHPDHAALAVAVATSLNRQLEGKRCRVYSSDLRVRVLATGFAGYPDVTVVCNKLELDPADANTATNPAVAVEILSPSTEQYDRGEKLRQYQAMPSLLHVVLVAHDERRIDVWTRRGDDWSVTSARPGEHADLPGIRCALVVDDVYRDPLSA